MARLSTYRQVLPEAAPTVFTLVGGTVPGVPALLTSISIWPNSSRAFFTILSTSSRMRISALRAIALRPKALTSAAVCSAPSRLISLEIMSHPSLARVSAIVFPKPFWLPVPVTRAILSLKPRTQIKETIPHQPYEIFDHLNTGRGIEARPILGLVKEHTPLLVKHRREIPDINRP